MRLYLLLEEEIVRPKGVTVRVVGVYESLKRVEEVFDSLCPETCTSSSIQYNYTLDVVELGETYLDLYNS